jgi:hypothetical protein
MDRTNACHRVAALGSILAFAAIAQPTSAATAVDKTFAVSSASRIELANTFGDVHIDGWDRAEVGIGGSLGARSNLVVAQSPAALKISAEPPQGHSEYAAEPSHLVVHVPRSMAVAVRTVAAGVIARGLTGSLDIGSSTGDIVVDTASTAVHVTSVTGAVTVADSAADSTIALSDTSGAVKVSGAKGTLTWDSIAGSMELAQCAPTRVDLRSTSGRIDLRCAITKGATYQVASKYGPVGFHTVSAPDARFVLTSRFGRISTAYGSAALPQTTGAGDRSSTFTVGHGEASVTMQTESGSIILD